MDYWMRKRLSWWIKYAEIPAEFSLVDEDCRKQFIQDGDEALADTMIVQVRYLGYNYPSKVFCRWILRAEDLYIVISYSMIMYNFRVNHAGAAAAKHSTV
jgi:hypothetical protein